VELISFATTGKLQPFLVSLHTSALIVMDVHCSLTTSEVVGYLGGVWDMNNNSKLMLLPFKIRDISVLFSSINGETLLSRAEPIS
jgi:MPN domain-containing protein